MYLHAGLCDKQLPFAHVLPRGVREGGIWRRFPEVRSSGLVGLWWPCRTKYLWGGYMYALQRREFCGDCPPEV